MRKLRLLVSIGLLLLSATSLHAQWSGTVDASGGFGMMIGLRSLGETGKYPCHWLGKSSASILYKDSLYTWKTTLSGSFESVDKDYLKGESFHTEEDVTINGYLSLSRNIPYSSQIRSEVAWNLGPGRSITAWGQYHFDGSYAFNVNTVFDQDLNMGAYADMRKSWNHNMGTGMNFTLRMDSPRRVLAGSFTYGHVSRRQSTEYYTVDMSDEENLWADVFRLTPRAITDQFNAVLHFKDSLLTGKVKLVLDPGLRMTGSRSFNENSGATASGYLEGKEDYQWRDSTEIRELFNFLSLDTEPYLAADLITKHLRIHADYALKLYARELNDDIHKEGLHFMRPDLVGKSSINWKIASDHNVSLANSLSVRYPTYLQVCWFDRSGGYIDRIYRGNPQLKPNKRHSYNFDYTFNHKQFTSSSSVSFSHSRNEIVQTWFREEIDGREYQVFTWVNGAESKTLGLSQDFEWDGDIFMAGLGAEYNRSWRKRQESDKVSKSDDWNFHANAGVNMGKGWRADANVQYQSAVTSFFALFSDYCLLNAKVSKSFKNLTIYLEGRHLADKPENVRVESEDGNHINVEMSYLNRRVIILGCKWRF